MALTLSNYTRNNLIEILRTNVSTMTYSLLNQFGSWGGGSYTGYSGVLFQNTLSSSTLIPFDPNQSFPSLLSPTVVTHGVPDIRNYVSGVNAGQAHLNSPPLLCVSPFGTTSNTCSITYAKFIAYTPSYNTVYTPVASATVGLHGSGADIIVNNTNAVVSTATQSISITDMTFYLPQTLGSISLSSNLQNDLLRTILYTNGGLKNHVTNSTINFYTGEAPYSADATASGTLLASINLGTSAPFDAPVQGISSLNTVLTSATPVASGVIGYFRWVSPSPSNYTIQGSVGLPNSGADIIVETLSVTPSTPVRVTFMSLQF